jgi:Repeat of unknown function (DUF346)
MAGPINWFKNVVLSSTNSPGWGRILLSDQEGDNLITYTNYGGTPQSMIKVAKSNDMATWTEIASIPSPTGHIQEQSQMVRLLDGTILMAMRNRQIDLNWFGLPILKSTDGGHSWSYVSQLDTNPNSNGCFNRGLWEPFLYVLPNGSVAGFYANEKHADDNTPYSQIISERVSSDGGRTWGPEIYAAAQPASPLISPECCRCGDASHPPPNTCARPGMPGFARMANGQYILVFEVCGTQSGGDNCNIHYKFSNDGTTWSNGLGTAIPHPVGGSVQLGGPYVCVLSTGRILVTSNTNQISISDDNGESWYLNDPPAWIAGPDHPTWPAIYQTESSEVGVVVNLNGVLQIKFGRDVPHMLTTSAKDPATMVYGVGTGGQQHMFYRGNDGGIYHVWWSPGPPPAFGNDKWSGPNASTSAPTAAGDPATMVIPWLQQQHIFYRGTDGGIYHVWWGPNPPPGTSNFGHDQWSGPNVPSDRPAQAAAGDPATMVIPWLQQQHIFYRGTDGGIYHVWWGPNNGFGNDKWSGPNASTSAPTAAGDPATMLYDQQQHIFYRGNDGGIYHVWWSPGPPPAFGNDKWA